MPAYHIERSVRISADPSQVRPAVEDFAEWIKWSPWLCMEPTARVDVYGTPGGTDHGYDWDGELVGAGGMQITAADAERLKMDLGFIRPFKSKAKVMLEIISIGDAETEVTWHMDGKMPFFLFFMMGMMKAMIGMDYDRGLKMLKEYVETGEIKSKLEIVGVVDVPQSHYVGAEDHCAIADIGDSMTKTMPTAHHVVAENQLEMQGPPGALYHRVDCKSRQCHYTAIVPVAQPAQIEGVKSGSIEACRAVKVVHTGSYTHLGNAWSTAIAFQRYKKWKPHKSQCGFEIYLNDPTTTPEEDWITEVYVPVRS